MIYVPPEERPPVQFRSRERIILLAGDEIAYGELLTRAFPRVRFWDEPPRNVLEDRNRPPDALPLRSLAECQNEYVEIYFDPDWLPRWEWDEEFGLWDDGPRPFPNARFERTTKFLRDGEYHDVREDARRTWGVGRIYFRIIAGNKEHESIARKALRLLNKVASSENLMMAYTETLEIFNLDARYAPLIGHHARRWCLEKPDRLLNANPGLDGCGYRPKPEGFVPPPVLAPPPHKNEAILRARAESEAVLRELPSIVRSRGWFATPADEIAYADLLAETFPGVRFVEEAIRTSAHWPMPDIRPQASLADCFAKEVHVVFDPSWDLRWRSVWVKEDYWQWTYGAIPLPNGTILRRTFAWAAGFDKPRPIDMDKTTTLCASWIYIRVEPGNKEHEAIARKVFGLIGKIANRRNLVLIANKTFEIVDASPRRTPWVGNDARRWCLEKPDRRLTGLGSGYSVPPNSSYRPKPE